MGRDDDKPVNGLQGGTAPARAFASYMKIAVANRPVEKFDTEVTLPAWQLEPDDEAILPGNPDDYYYPDDQGNLVEPRAPDQEKLPPDHGEPEQVAAPPPAANEEFLDQATGKKP
jgi:penicillin-binding protein 1A